MRVPVKKTGRERCESKGGLAVTAPSAVFQGSESVKTKEENRLEASGARI